MSHPMSRVILASALGTYIVITAMLRHFGYPLPAAYVGGIAIMLAAGLVYSFLNRVGDDIISQHIMTYTMVGATFVSLAAFVFLLSAIPPLALLGGSAAMAVPVVLYGRRQRTRRLRIETGCCAQCGYDLRASSDYCPECNAPVPHEILRMRRIRAEMMAARAAPAAAPPTAAPPAGADNDSQPMPLHPPSHALSPSRPDPETSPPPPRQS